MLNIKPNAKWDLVSLGEVMLRFDPGDMRVETTRNFRVWEGGGEYNVARGLKRCFGLRTTVVTAIADNSIGRLIQDLIFQGGVDQSHIRWVPYDGVGRTVRNGLNFTERGFGVRAASGCSDRGNTAISQLEPGDINWDVIFEEEESRWFHTGGIFAALSRTTAETAREAMDAARRHGTIVSYDLNYRESLWKFMGGHRRAAAVNRSLVSKVDVLIGNEEDFTTGLGFEVEGLNSDFSNLSIDSYRKMMEQLLSEFPNVRIVAATLRNVKSASRNDWGAICYCDGNFYQSITRENLEIYDRIGGGDSFSSGLIFGLLSGRGEQWALECGAAHGALAMTTPGDTSMATLLEVEKLMKGHNARVVR
jgi:2-dehydro-3-deoxygluconokinase